ncbi:MAG: MFS transporter [Ktedonobacteraceae bacterium]
MASNKHPVSLWRNLDYLLLWGGQTISTIGTGVSTIAYPLLVLMVTGSPAQAGFISALRALIYMVLVLPAGALLDRWDRKQVMIICDVGRALSLGSIALAAAFGHLTLLQLYITSLVEVALGTFFNIAEISCIPQVVAKEQLPAAMGRVQATDGIATLIGPPLGGTLFALRSLLPFLADAVSYVISVGSLLVIRTSFQEKRNITVLHLHLEIAEGLHWLWRQPLIRSMAFITGINVFCGAGYTLIIIIIAQLHNASDSTIGLIFGIGGVGGILGSLLVGTVQKRLSFAQIVVGTLWLTALFWSGLIALPDALLLGLITAALFFITPFYNTVYISYRLALTPDALRGRVNSVARLIGFGLAPIGLALTGILLQVSGARSTLLFLVGIQVVLALVATMNTSIRHARLLIEG